MSAPSLAATADGELENFGTPAMSAPSLAATAVGELENVGKCWLACVVEVLSCQCSLKVFTNKTNFLIEVTHKRWLQR
jgi:hypothetical protein